MISLKPIVTEKAVRMIETQNVLTFETEKENTKEEIKKEIEKMFNVKIEKVGVLIRNNKKCTYVKLKPEFQAIDVATKIGVI